ncbi:MAG: pyridoxal phosphate-dependent aminotransferase [Clostridia bacterium]|nr:pyridoxal phosphate-dependent aminotransferase [Clostridia bacterium]
MDVLEKAKEMEKMGEDIIHLEIGEPDFDTPEPIKEAAAKAMGEGHTHYTHSQGLLELREEICRYYHENYDVGITPDRVVITSGTSPAMLLVFSALLNSGDEVLLSNPHYSCYPNFIKYSGGIPIPFHVKEENNYLYPVDKIKESINSRTAALVVNSPSNPTGAVLPRENLEALSMLDIPIISDEIYHGLTYGEKAHSILEFDDHAIVVNGFSKLYAMTGWRLGYAIVPKELMRAIRNMQQNLFICANSFVQHAAIAALKYCSKHVEKMRQEYDTRRKFILKNIKDTGLEIEGEPTGAFYVFANAGKFSDDSYKLAFDILDKAKVALTPGIDFGSRGEGYLRISYANSLENIGEGMRRLGRYFKNK